MDNLLLIGNSDWVINDFISIHPPTLKEIRDIGEKKYFVGVHSLCATPSDYKVQLFDEHNLDWEEISDYEFFLMNRRNIDAEVSKLLLCGVSVGSLLHARRIDTDEDVLCSADGNVVIDEAIYWQFVSAIRELHRIEHRKDIAGNATTKAFMLKKERRQLERRKEDGFKSLITPALSALVNSAGFKYDYTTVFDLTIFQFTDALQAIRKEKAHTSLMRGIYAGTVDTKKLSLDALQWP